MKLEKSSDESTADNSMDTSGSIGKSCLCGFIELCTLFVYVLSAKRNKERHVIQEEPEVSVIYYFSLALRSL